MTYAITLALALFVAYVVYRIRRTYADRHRAAIRFANAPPRYPRPEAH